MKDNTMLGAELLGRRAVLFHLTRACWNGQVVDQTPMKVIKRHFKTEAKGDRYVKQVLEQEFLTNLTTASTRIYTHYRKFTIPWESRGAGLLPTKIHSDFMEVMHGLIDDHEIALQWCIDHLHEQVESGPERMQKLFNLQDFPSASDMRRLYRIEYKFRPVPVMSDIRCDLPEEVLEEMRASAAQDYAEIERGLTSRLYERLLIPVKEMAEKLAQSNGKASFRDTILTKLAEECEVLSKLNITQDPRLDETISLINSTLLQHSYSDLKESKKVRKQATKEVQDVIGKISLYI